MMTYRFNHRLPIQYHVRATERRISGCVIPKYFYRNGTGIGNTEVPHPRLGEETKIEAEELMGAARSDPQWHHLCDWSVVVFEAQGMVVVSVPFNLHWYWQSADMREHRQQAIDRRFFRYWELPRDPVEVFPDKCEARNDHGLEIYRWMNDPPF